MSLKGRLIFYGSALSLLASAVFYATSMPDSSFTGKLPPATRSPTLPFTAIPTTIRHPIGPSS